MYASHILCNIFLKCLTYRWYGENIFFCSQMERVSPTYLTCSIIVTTDNRDGGTTKYEFGLYDTRGNIPPKVSAEDV